MRLVSKLRGTMDPIPSVTLQAEATLPTRFGIFSISVFNVAGSPGEIAALTRGPLHGEAIPLVRLHSECLTGDVLGSLRCDCGQQLEAALERIAEARSGVLLYLPQEGRGIGLANKIRAYALQDRGLDTVDANLALGLPVDRRDYAAAAHILRGLGLRQVRLLTNNPLKTAALECNGIEVVERVPLAIPPNAVNSQYLRTKADRMGHLLAFER
jgi:GTP cyclohydrolase II